MSQLDQLKQFSTVVADTGDFTAIKSFAPQDSTTNPTLIYKAVQMEAYQPLLAQAIKDRSHQDVGEHSVQEVMDALLICFGTEILKIVPGRVSTEVDARLSFDTAATIAKAHELIERYKQKGISKERVLIKISATWEGIQAAKQLAKEGIHCNMTLVFSLAQAVAAAEAQVQLISPFVGRITDWYQVKQGHPIDISQDPGVASVKEIYNYYKQFDYKTEIMAASFRTPAQILELAGCDLLTISPALLETLAKTDSTFHRRLNLETAKSTPISKVHIDEAHFRWMLNENAMATEKLAEGIRLFAEDARKLELIVRKQLHTQ